MGKRAHCETCDATEGISLWGGNLVRVSRERLPETGFISFAQTLEYDENRSYDRLNCWADALSDKDVAKLLEETIQEESQTTGNYSTC